MSQNTFKQHMQNNYDLDELQDIASHGCESGCAAGMIYYSETTALFDQYRYDLFDIMADYMSEMGYEDTLPEYVLKNSGTFGTFANAVVWFCAEVVAYELTNQESEEE